MSGYCSPVRCSSLGRLGRISGLCTAFQLRAILHGYASLKYLDKSGGWELGTNPAPCDCEGNG